MTQLRQAYRDQCARFVDSKVRQNAVDGVNGLSAAGQPLGYNGGSTV